MKAGMSMAKAVKDESRGRLYASNAYYLYQP